MIRWSRNSRPSDLACQRVDLVGETNQAVSMSGRDCAERPQHLSEVDIARNKQAFLTMLKEQLAVAHGCAPTPIAPGVGAPARGSYLTKPSAFR